MARPGHIYVMDCGDGVVKVGFSNNPERRSEDLGGLQILHVTEWDDRAELIEKSAHKLLKLAGCHVENELFRTALSDAVEAIERASDLIASGEVINGPSARRKKTVSFAIDPNIMVALDEWISRQVVKPSKTAVIETALRNFLDSQLG